MCIRLRLWMGLFFLICGVFIVNAEDVVKDTIWEKDQTIRATIKVHAVKLRVQPGVSITFEKGGKILLTHGSSFIAEGTDKTPITFQGAGLIEGYGANLSLKECLFTKVGAISDKKMYSINLSSASKRNLNIENCTFTNSGKLYLKTGGGNVSVIRSTFIHEPDQLKPSISVYGGGEVVIEENNLRGASISLTGGSDGIVRSNVVLSGAIGAWRTKSLLIEKNYIHQPLAKGSYCIPGAKGIIRDNVLRGGSWVTAKITGKMLGNVLIALPHKGYNSPDAFNTNCTHEHICGMGPNSVVRRNIFIGVSYAAVMGLGTQTATHLEFSNNTLDMKDKGRSVMLNHLPETPSEKIKIRNNIFMRCLGVQDEKGVKDSASIVDYNLWSNAPTKGMRYDKIFIKGLVFGDNDFGKHDLPAKKGNIPPRKVVKNADVKFPCSDKELFLRKYSVDDVLKHYREAYSLIPSSPAINAGDSTITDKSVTDGKPDIGAVEYKARR